MQLNPRTLTLINNIKKDFQNVAVALGWTISLDKTHDDHSCIIFSVMRDAVVHKCGYLYSQSTAKEIYRLLEKDIEIILIPRYGFSVDSCFA